eukprot:GHVO01036112.1.p1 GENE.GHVO01036112.1~~GHVO01036112.1.p1  ORF type:complete len:329 (+),score=32.91 GHVO01036112.1:92-1078(+)
MEDERIQVVPESWFDSPEKNAPTSPIEESVPKTTERKKTVVQEEELRPSGGRRMTFRMPRVPYATQLSEGEFVEGAQTFVGDDVISEGQDSDDDPWVTGSPADPDPLEGVDQKKVVSCLLLEIERANEETNQLYKSDSLGDSFKVMQEKERNRREEDILKEDESQGTRDAPALKSPSPRPDEEEPKKPLVELKELEKVYESLGVAYAKGKNVIKITTNCKKVRRRIFITSEHLRMKSHATSARVHLSRLGNVTLGYTSSEFRGLLDQAGVDTAVPPPQVCASVRLPERTLSLVLPSEQARNEFVFLLRVAIREAKGRYGDHFTPNNNF